MAHTFPSDWYHIVNKHDPAGLIAVGAPKDEYYDEIGKLQDEAPHCKSIEQLLDSIHRIFNKSLCLSADREQYRALAIDLWEFSLTGAREFTEENNT
jgi:hypothetical protein